MSDRYTLRCDECGRPLVECGCPPGAGPADGDLVTQDCVLFFEWAGEPWRSPVIAVEVGEDWKTQVMTWMFKNKHYPEVWMDLGDDDYRRLTLDMGDDAEDDFHA